MKTNNRLHISIFGKANVGKSSLINAITGQNVSIVSNISGTTTDSVHKAMEIQNIGACTLIDTAGFDDNSQLGNLRIEKTKEIILKTDIAILVISQNITDIDREWFEKIKHIPLLFVINEFDNTNSNEIYQEILNEFSQKAIICNAITTQGINDLRISIADKISYDSESITGKLINNGDTVLLVMPQDASAPKGRLILPQVQTIRELIDKNCTIISTNLENLENSLNTLKNPPNMIITDSQVFKNVYDLKPKQSKITSFSILFAGYKGDIEYFVQSAKLIDNLDKNSKILIAESCTHAPLEEDIGRVKIPNMLRKKLGDNIKIEVFSGSDFPKDLSKYKLIIQCGACMFNKQHVLSRIEIAKQQKIPMTNYGIAIAYLSGILDKVEI